MKQKEQLNLHLLVSELQFPNETKGAARGWNSGHHVESTVLFTLCPHEVVLAIRDAYGSFEFAATDGFHTLIAGNVPVTWFQVLETCLDFSFM